MEMLLFSKGLKLIRPDENFNIDYIYSEELLVRHLLIRQEAKLMNYKFDVDISVIYYDGVTGHIATIYQTDHLDYTPIIQFRIICDIVDFLLTGSANETEDKLSDFSLSITSTLNGPPDDQAANFTSIGAEYEMVLRKIRR